MVAAMLNETKYNTSLGLSAIFYNSDFSKLSSYISSAVAELKSRANQPGQFLNWVDLPKNN